MDKGIFAGWQPGRALPAPLLAVLAFLVAAMAAAMLAAAVPASAYAAPQASAPVGTPLTTSAQAQQIQQTQQAQQADLANGVYQISTALKPGMRLEIGGASTANGARANLYADNATPAQRWRFEKLSNGYYRITNVGTGKVLDVAGAHARNGGVVQQYAWNGTKAQQWAVVPVAGGYKIYSAVSGRYVLDVPGAYPVAGACVQLYAANGTKAQTWAVTPVEPAVPDGTYTLKSAASGKVLDVAGGGVDNASNVQQYAANGTMAQTFKLAFDKNTGYYRVLGVASGLVLDVAGGCNANGANVQLYTANGTRAQQWAITKNADDTYTLRSALGGRALDVSGASKANGANVQTYASNGTKAQKWTLASVDQWLPDGTYNVASALNTNRSVAVAARSHANGANVRMEQRGSFSQAQKWTFARDAATGAYTLKNVESGLMLEAAGAAGSGANVRQAKATGEANQLWQADAYPGGIRFASAANPAVVLDVAGASTASGANLQVYTANGTTAQRFRLRPASPDGADLHFKVYLNPGHGWNSNGNGAYDPGAIGSGYREADLTDDLAKRVVPLLEAYGIEVVNGADYKVAYWKRLPKAAQLGCDCIVSIHFDAGGRSGTMTMLGVQEVAPGSETLRRCIHTRLVAALGLPDLGVTRRSDITCVNGKIPSMLMEVCFVDNASDVRRYLARRDAVAQAIADGIYEYALSQ